jgi:glycerophosphoryl diester phosphodiesterase
MAEHWPELDADARPALPGSGMKRSIELHGHRGARGLFPENTLVGFAGALAIGVDTLELDVAMTSDDVVVVSHDPALNPNITRTLDGAWLARHGPPIRSLRVAELARYDVGRIRPGSAYAAAFPDQASRDGARVPLLKEVLRIDPDVKFNIELKTFPSQPELTVDGATMAAAVLAVADANGTSGRITVQSFDWRGPRHVRRTRPDIRVAWLTRAAILARARVWWDGPDPSDYGDSVPRVVAAEGGRIWGPEHVDLTEETLAEAHGLGLLVIPWTVNRPDDMRRLIGWGIDGLITDRPDIARAVMGT